MLFFVFCIIASKKKRNLILDQTNVYPSARRRKMKNFRGFIRRAAVMVPDDPELVRRSEKRTYEDGMWLLFFSVVASDKLFLEVCW